MIRERTYWLPLNTVCSMTRNMLKQETISIKEHSCWLPVNLYVCSSVCWTRANSSLRKRVGNPYHISNLRSFQTVGLLRLPFSMKIFFIFLLTYYQIAFFLCFALSPIGEKQGHKRKCFLKNPKNFFGDFSSGASRKKAGLGWQPQQDSHRTKWAISEIWYCGRILL